MPLTARSRSLVYSGGPLDGAPIAWTFPLPTRIRVPYAGRVHRYVLADEPKLHHPNGGGHLRIEYRYEGPTPGRA